MGSYLFDSKENAMSWLGKTSFTLAAGLLANGHATIASVANEVGYAQLVVDVFGGFI